MTEDMDKDIRKNIRKIHKNKSLRKKEINPYKLATLIVFISFMSFLGYYFLRSGTITGMVTGTRDTINSCDLFVKERSIDMLPDIECKLVGYENDLVMIELVKNNRNFEYQVDVVSINGCRTPVFEKLSTSVRVDVECSDIKSKNDIILYYTNLDSGNPYEKSGKLYLII